MRSALVAVTVCALAGCGGTWPVYETLRGPPPAPPPDAGPPPDPPPSVSFTTALGSLTGSEAFRVVSAQTILRSADGGPTYIGFQVADTSQCLPAELDGGAGATPIPVSHILTGFVMSEDGSPLQMGTYDIGMTPDGRRDVYLQIVEFDRASGTNTMLLATSGTITLESLSAGELHGRIDVQLGEPTHQLELPLTGNFQSKACVPQ